MRAATCHPACIAPRWRRWLEIRPAYKSACIIDGQHRLFGYSGHERAAKARLSVLAFTGLKPSEQARLFIEINSKQKKVSQILLQTLIAELNWDADSPQVRLGAIISKAIQVLDAESKELQHARGAAKKQFGTNTRSLIQMALRNSWKMKRHRPTAVPKT